MITLAGVLTATFNIARFSLFAFNVYSAVRDASKASQNLINAVHSASVGNISDALGYTVLAVAYGALTALSILGAMSGITGLTGAGLASNFGGQALAGVSGARAVAVMAVENRSILQQILVEALPAVVTIANYSVGNGGGAPSSNSSSRPSQKHHYATNKSKRYTARLQRIADKYGLKLEEN
ncbi:hypothetical protein LNTAR_23899 [Lentisphaera araneosa HTCC2155]|jgi:hypothetical protein|uniref:Uncharacterized protein n=1 Tax=Lentisphaera araneosa HTCC2155 TaxID=313628 RepID=A6DU51_9BACT|nr:hypothetical protein [Lentisphaera araneosa]EDM24847.1 hypothetical protein LNTAR_23899 [Lentisphaera araneosa HTCC2155]